MMPRLRCLFFLCGFTGFAIHQARAQAAYDKIGQASWYGAEEAGRRTSSGIPFDPGRLSAAHRSLPLGSCVRVTQLGNHKSVVVPVIDRGPFVHGRLLDLSQAAAERLDMIKAGLAKVRIVLTSCTNGALPKATL